VQRLHVCLTGLLARAIEVVEITAPTASGATVVMYNVHRVDARASAIDHDAFVVVVHASGASTAGHFIHHGGWEGRTTPHEVPSDYTNEITSSGIASYYQARPMTGASSGELSELSGGNAAAFQVVTGLVLNRST